MILNVLEDLKESTDLGIFIPKVDQIVSCYGCTDADWARDHSKKISRTGLVLFLNSALAFGHLKYKHQQMNQLQRQNLLHYRHL